MPAKSLVLHNWGSRAALPGYNDLMFKIPVLAAPVSKNGQLYKEVRNDIIATINDGGIETVISMFEQYVSNKEERRVLYASLMEDVTIHLDLKTKERMGVEVETRVQPLPAAQKRLSNSRRIPPPESQTNSLLQETSISSPLLQPTVMTLHQRRNPPPSTRTPAGPSNIDVDIPEQSNPGTPEPQRSITSTTEQGPAGPVDRTRSELPSRNPTSHRSMTLPPPSLRSGDEGASQFTQRDTSVTSPVVEAQIAKTINDAKRLIKDNGGVVSGPRPLTPASFRALKDSRTPIVDYLIGADAQLEVNLARNVAKLAKALKSHPNFHLSTMKKTFPGPGNTTLDYRWASGSGLIAKLVRGVTMKSDGYRTMWRRELDVSLRPFVKFNARWYPELAECAFMKV